MILQFASKYISHYLFIPKGLHILKHLLVTYHIFFCNLIKYNYVYILTLHNKSPRSLFKIPNKNQCESSSSLPVNALQCKALSIYCKSRPNLASKLHHYRGPFDSTIKMIYRATRSSAQEYNTTLFIASKTDNKHLGERLFIFPELYCKLSASNCSFFKNVAGN